MSDIHPFRGGEDDVRIGIDSQFRWQSGRSYELQSRDEFERDAGGRWRQGGGSAVIDRTLADNYEYVMHGRVFDVSYGKDGIVEIAISFGGLLCRLTGDQRHLSSILPDMRLYLLVKKD